MTKRSLAKTQQKLLLRLHDSAYTARVVYGAAAKDGFAYASVMHAQILKKLGSKTANKIMTNEDFVRINRLMSIQDNYEPRPKVKIDLSKKEIALLIKVIKKSQASIKQIPAMALQQYIITLELILEVYISDTIRNIFDHIPESMKSSRTTLKDEEVVDSHRSGNALEVLREKRVRDIMYGDEASWIKFLQGLGLKIESSSEIIELGLIRNCLVHNNGVVSQELARTETKFKEGRKLRITEQSASRYNDAIRSLAGEIWKEISKHYKK